MRLKDIICVGKDEYGNDGYNAVIELDNGEVVYIVPGNEIKAAQQSVQTDVACACGHQWLSHNDNGCCWDDECQCTRPAANANSV